MMHGRLAIAALVAALALAALGSTASGGSNARILSLKIAPTKVHKGKTGTVSWELTKAATTKFQVARCMNSKCTKRVAVGKEVSRKGGAGLNTLKLKLNVSPNRYALVVRAGQSTRKVLFRVVK